MPGYPTNTGGQFIIPYMVQPAPASELGEARAACITANSLDGIRRALKNGGYCIFAEGTYLGTFSSGNSSVSVSGGSASLDAIVAGVWVKTSAAQTWNGLLDSTTNYLYAQLIESNIYISGQLSSRQGLAWAPISSTSGTTPTNSLLLAVATTTGSGITVVATAEASDAGLFVQGKPYWLSTTSGSDSVATGALSKTVSYANFTTNGRVSVVKTSIGPAIDYIEKAPGQFTVHLVGPAAPGDVTFDWIIDRI